MPGAGEPVEEPLCGLPCFFVFVTQHKNRGMQS